MALRLVDKLFTTTTLMHSTVHGTKDFAALDPSKIAAIKGISHLASLKHFDNLQLVIGLTVFDAILTGRQSGQKLQCLYGNSMANNFEWQISLKLIEDSLFFAAEVLGAFSYQCRNSEETARMWDQCKVSIGKRCQNLRIKDRQTRQD